MDEVSAATNSYGAASASSSFYAYYLLRPSGGAFFESYHRAEGQGSLSLERFLRKVKGVALKIV